MTNEQLILKREILFKEEEKHQLVYIGAIKDLSNAINQTLLLYKDSIVDKTKLLFCFYDEVVKYKKFIENQRKTNKRLRNNIYNVSKLYLTSKKKNDDAILDKELKCKKISFSWFFPTDIFDNFYSQFCQCDKSFIIPSYVKSFFQEQIDIHYPIVINKYISYLKESRISFWELTCLYIKDIVDLVAHHTLFDQKQIEQFDLIKDSAWTDIYEILHSKLQNESILKFNNGVDFRNYIISIANYRVQNQRVKFAVKEESFESLTYSVYESEEEFEDNITVTSIDDIDIQNAYEVAYAISIILLDSSHPLYQPLVQGLEDKIDILLRKVVDGQSYNTIVKEKWNIHPGSENFSKAVVRARKELERIRKTLQDRFIRLKNEHK